MTSSIFRTSVSTALAMIVVLVGAYLWLRAKAKPTAPRPPVVSACKQLEPGMKRIGENGGFQFDFATYNIKVVEHEGSEFGRGISYDLTVIDNGSNTDAYLYISMTQGDVFEDFNREIKQWGPETRIRDLPLPSALIPSERFETRRIYDARRTVVGEDLWGYWDTGERWRRIRLGHKVIARYGAINEKGIASYGSVREKEAATFDRVIDSACVAPHPNL